MRRQQQPKRSPLKATQWRKKGLDVPRDSDGAYRVRGRLDGRNLLRETRETQES